MVVVVTVLYEFIGFYGMRTLCRCFFVVPSEDYNDGSYSPHGLDKFGVFGACSAEEDFCKKAYVRAILAAAYAVTSIIRVVLETGSPRFQSNFKCCV